MHTLKISPFVSEGANLKWNTSGKLLGGALGEVLGEGAPPKSLGSASIPFEISALAKKRQDFQHAFDNAMKIDTNFMIFDY